MQRPHEGVSSPVPQIRREDDELGAGALQTEGLLAQVLGTFVPEAVLDEVRAGREVHRPDDDLPRVQAAQLLADGGVDDFVVLYRREVCAAADDADGFQFL